MEISQCALIGAPAPNSSKKKKSVICHLSHVMCHVSSVTWSPVTYHLTNPRPEKKHVFVNSEILGMHIWQKNTRKLQQI